MKSIPDQFRFNGIPVSFQDKKCEIERCCGHFAVSAGFDDRSGDLCLLDGSGIDDTDLFWLQAAIITDQTLSHFY